MAVYMHNSYGNIPTYTFIGIFSTSQRHTVTSDVMMETNSVFQRKLLSYPRKLTFLTFLLSSIVLFWPFRVPKITFHVWRFTRTLATACKPSHASQTAANAEKKSGKLQYEYWSVVKVFARLNNPTKFGIFHMSKCCFALHADLFLIKV